MSDERQMREAALAAAMRSMGSYSPAETTPSNSRRFAGHSLGRGGFRMSSDSERATNFSLGTTRQRPEEHFITISQNGESSWDFANYDDHVGIMQVFLFCSMLYI